MRWSGSESAVAAQCSQWIACSPVRDGRRRGPLNKIVRPHLKILQTSPRIQASIPALAIIIGVITTFLMHASIFGRGSAWRESLLTAAGALFIAAFVLVVAYVGSSRVVIFLLGLPFVGTDVML